MVILGFVTAYYGRSHIRITSLVHTSFVLTLFALGIGAGFVQLRLGIAPFERLRERLLGVRDGLALKVTGVYPAEVQPLVDDLNALLDQRDEAVRRAQAKAGDLAHGLKTPLAVIAHEAARAAAAGDREFAAVIRHEVDRITRQVDFHLAHARAAASSATLRPNIAVRASADGLARTLSRLHAERGLVIDVNVADDVKVRLHREDLDEMLGNLMDNACRWARTRVAVSATREASGAAITVDDDGPGIEVSMREAMLQRGMRADEAAPGSGFGLAIVRDLSEVYGGSITLTEAPIGGLRAVLRLP
jgi:signal transduction histidine kinase